MKISRIPLASLRRISTTLIVIAATSLFAVAQTENVLYRFKGGADSGLPDAGLIKDEAGNFYGTTSGFRLGCGTVFELKKPTGSRQPWTEQILYTFTCENEGTPWAALIMDSAGNLYGTTYFNAQGNVFELSPPAVQGGAWTETVLHTFTAKNGDGGGSVASLAMDAAGSLYGTTENGGSDSGDCRSSNGCGVVFELAPPGTQGGAWTETIIHTFHGVDGDIPAAGVTLDRAGNLYGTTFYGGSSKVGVVFRLTLKDGAWHESVLHNFAGGNDGANPAANLVLRGDTLYGTTVGSVEGGGCQGSSCGTVFELSPPAVVGDNWTINTLYAFLGGADGASPYASVVFDPSGNLYTTTNFGGASSYGTVTELSPPAVLGNPWTETILYSFTNGIDGGRPEGNLLLNPSGVLFSTTNSGGDKCASDGTCGTVFQLKL
jgi:uncharacterized repeat protein (TIGR03803 family)